MSDFTVTSHGSLVLLQPLSSAAEEWCGEFLPEDRMTFGTAVVIEPRYIGPILNGIVGDGLTLGEGQ